MTKTVVGLYDDSATAERTVRALEENGFAREDISLVAQDATHGNQPPMSDQPAIHTDTVADGTAAGAGTGAVIGGLAGLLLGLGALAIPGLGPLIAAGPLAAVLAGAGTGAIAGGLIGALVDAGLSEEQAEAYAEGVRRGGMLVMLRAPDNRAADAVRIMNQYGAIDMEQRAREWREQNPINQDVATAGATGSTTENRADTTAYSRDLGEHTPGHQDWSTHDRDVAGAGTPALTEDQLAGSTSGGEAWSEWHGANPSSSAAAGDAGADMSQSARTASEQAGSIKTGPQMTMPETPAGSNTAAIPPARTQPASAPDMAKGQAAPRSGTSSGANRSQVAQEHEPEPMQTQTAAGEDPDFSGIGHGDWESRDVGEIIAHDAASDDVWKTEDASHDREMAQDQGQVVNPDMARNPQAELEDVAGGDASGSSGMNNQDWRSRELGAGGQPGPGGVGAWQSGTSTGATRGSYDAFTDDFRGHHAMVFGAGGRAFDQQEPGYRFGYDLAQNPDYQGRKWTEIEPNAQRDWARSQPDLAWDEYRAAIRHGWERVTSNAGYQSSSSTPDAGAMGQPTTGALGDADQMADRG